MILYIYKNMVTNILILLILIGLSAFFSASEVAFVSLTDAKVQSMVERKLPRAILIKHLTKNSRRLLVTILIGNNIVNIASASLATLLASEFFNSAVLGVTTGVMTIIILVFGEIVPKSYAANHPKRFAIFSARYIQILQVVGAPIIYIFEKLTNLMAGDQIHERVSEEELRAMATASAKQGAIERGEGKMIERLFLFNDIAAEDIMTPRVDVTYLDKSMTQEDMIKRVKEHPYTRYPLAKETPDNILGFIHSRDLFMAATEKEKTSLQKITRPILHVPRQLPIDELLKEFQKKQTHMAVVMDEYGGTEGIVTLEDVLEELVGEIADEHDVEEELIKRIDKYTILVSGDETIREINEFLNVKIKGDPLDTIAERINEETQKVPRRGVTVKFDDVTCTIDSTRKKVIQTVVIKKNQQLTEMET